MNKIYFFKEHSVIGCLSNFSPHPIDLAGLIFPTAEHLFQSWKFIRTDPEWAEYIRLSPTPDKAKYHGRNKMHTIMPTWNEERVHIMSLILFNKVNQHQLVKQVLLNTGDSELIEWAPWDEFWGHGKNGTGQNMLGKLWMELRANLGGNYNGNKAL